MTLLAEKSVAKKPDQPPKPSLLLGKNRLLLNDSPIGKNFSLVPCIAKYYFILTFVAMENTKAQMRKGVLELCILAIISERPAYPSDIIERLKAADLLVVEGTLYPLLTRLKDAGYLSYTWQESRSGPPRKYYALTEDGRRFLTELVEGWQSLIGSVATCLGAIQPTPGDGPPDRAEESTTGM
jgi:PadR family transcriptional regulator PadR